MVGIFSLSYRSLLLLISTLLFSLTLPAQSNRLTGPEYIEKLINEGHYEQARAELEQQLSAFRSERQYDTLVHYISYVGSFKLANNNKSLAIDKAKFLVAEIKEHSDAYITKEALLELAWLYDDAGEPEKAYEITQESLEYAYQIPNKQKADIESIEHQLGIRAKDIGNIALAKKHHLTALKLRKANPGKDYEGLYSIYNAVGGMMWHSAKLDSAMYYYRGALEALQKMDQNPLNSYYRPSIVQSNIAVLLQATGNVEEAIDVDRQAISDIQKYLEAPDDESRRLRAQKLKMSYIDNLGAFYHSIGEYKKADELITYSYLEKKKFFGS